MHVLSAGGGVLQKKWGWQCRYVQQYNAIGEAPDEVRQCFQQRSRWCKGHFQTFWSKQCPLVDRRLGLLFQLLYSSTCLSYISAGTLSAAFPLHGRLVACCSLSPAHRPLCIHTSLVRISG
jgi:cellulose synthase/poly-beta-1,6-N-acetylglucosamine synthase-like glycosyltransferase